MLLLQATYCNSVFAGLPNKSLRKLQLIQKAASWSVSQEI